METKQNKTTKNELFLDAVDYLFEKRLVSSQRELAQKIGIGDAALSRIKNNVKVVSDDTIRKMNEAFGNIFNMAYFRNGSDVLLVSDCSELSEQPNQPTSGGDLFAQMVADLRKDLDYFKKMVLAKDNIIQDNTGQLISLQSRLAAATAELEMVKADVHNRDQIIDTLKSELEYHRKRPFDAHPFPLGVAEPEPQRPHVSPSKP